MKKQKSYEDRLAAYKLERAQVIKRIENLVGSDAVVALEEVTPLLPVMPEWEVM